MLNSGVVDVGRALVYVFALVYVSAFRWLFDRVSGFALRAAGYRRRAVIVVVSDSDRALN